MIGTFMLEALRGAADVHDSLARLKLDWPHAMVLVSSRAGSNVSSGLTEGTNWLVLFLKAVSGFTLPDDRIKIVPYAEVRPSLGQAQLAPADLAYYVQRVWGPLFYRKVVSDQVFAGIPTIYLPDRPPLPGDYFVTQAGAIDQFMIRMKHSLRDAREMLSNTVAFWMVRGTGEQELGSGRGRHSRPDHRLSGRRRGLSRGDAAVALESARSSRADFHLLHEGAPAAEGGDVAGAAASPRPPPESPSRRGRRRAQRADRQRRRDRRDEAAELLPPASPRSRHRWRCRRPAPTRSSPGFAGVVARQQEQAIVRAPSWCVPGTVRRTT